MNPNELGDNQFHRFRKYYSSLEPMLEKPKNRIYTAIIFSFLAISLFGWYAILPTVKTILYLQREIADKTTVNEKMEQKIADLIEARSKLDEIQPQLYLIREAIPENPDALDLIFQTRNLVGSTPATLSALTVSSVPLISADSNTKDKKDSSTEFNIDTLVLGGYPALENILTGLNSMRRIVTVESMNFVLADTDTLPTSIAENAIKLSIHINSYYK